MRGQAGRWAWTVGVLAVLAASTAGAAPEAAERPAAKKRPNILLIVADDQSPFDLRAYEPQSKLQTPRLDRLAACGTVFDAAYHMGSFSGAVCTPSRHMIMSGRTVWRLPIAPGALAGNKCPPNLEQQTLPAVFKRAGYATMRTCKVGNSYEGANRQFEVRKDATKRGGDDEEGSAWHARQVLEYLDRREADGDRRPFFIFYGFSHPHDVRDGKPELLKKYGAVNHADPQSPPPADPLQPPLPVDYLPAHPFDHGHLEVRDEVDVSGVWRRRDPTTIRNEIGRQFACSENIDVQIGRVLDRLEALGELDDTYVIYTADHGMAIGRHGLQGKQNLYEHTWRVPLIVAGPGVRAGARAPGNVYLLDLLATCCDLTGVETPATSEGVSFKPVLEGKAETVRDVLYGVYSGGGKPGIRSVRRGDWKLIEYESNGGRARTTQLFHLGENPRELLVEHQAEAVRAASGAAPTPQQVNRAGDPQFAEQLSEMRELLLAEMRRLEDPYRFTGQPDDGLTPPESKPGRGAKPGRLKKPERAKPPEVEAKPAAENQPAAGAKPDGKPSSEVEAGRRRPNVVILYADDMGYGDLGVQNPESKIATPHLDRLARAGLRFTDAHSSSGICTPSRYALLTGRYHWRKFHDIVNSFDPPALDADELTLAELLRERGYRTACIGKWHLGWNWADIRRPGVEAARPKTGYEPGDFDWSKPVSGGPTSHGFDFYFGDDVPNFPPYAWIQNDRLTTTPSERLSITAKTAEGAWECRPGPMTPGWDFYAVVPKLADRTVEWIAEQRAAPGPFFLYVPFNSPHAPIVPSAEFAGKSPAGGFGDFMSQTDDVVGRILKALDDHGFTDDTLVLFTADNGPEHYAYERFRKTGHRSFGSLRGLKRDIYEGGHRVPFVVRWPGVVRPGSVSGALVSQIDVMATIAAIVGAELPAGKAEDSYDFSPVLRGAEAGPRRTLVHNTFAKAFAVRHDDWVLIDAADGAHSAVPPWFARQEGHGPHDRPQELYDLANDLGQRKNLVDERPDKVQELTELLKQVRRRGQVR